MSIGTGSFSDLATCRMPPPCMEGYTQFRMPGTDSMCCRRSVGYKLPKKTRVVGPKPPHLCKKKKACKKTQFRCQRTGRCMLNKNKDRCDAPKKRCIPRDDAPQRVSSKPGSINMKAAKELLRTNYSMVINGIRRAPGFITTLKGVTGKTPTDKIVNLRRVLSTCKYAGIPLLKHNGKGFKAYRTLVSQCKVTMTKPVQNIFAQRPGKSVNNMLLNKLKGLRANKSRDESINSFLGMPNKSQDESINSFLGMPNKSRGTVTSAMLARPAAPVQNLDEFYQDALNTPLPNDFGMRRLRFGFRRY